MRRRVRMCRKAAGGWLSRAVGISTIVAVISTGAAHAQQGTGPSTVGRPAGLTTGPIAPLGTASAESRVSRQPVSSGPRVLTLDEALALAEARSQQVQIAEAGVTRAESDQVRARSEWLPQVSASASYDRALATEFEGIFDALGPACTPFTLNPQAPLAERVGEI